MTPEQIAKYEAAIAQHGARKVAGFLVDKALNSIIGLGSSDLADTTIFANGLDEIEGMLNSAQYKEARDYAREVARDMLEDEGMSDELFEVRKMVRRELMAIQEGDGQPGSKLYVIRENEKTLLAEALRSFKSVIENGHERKEEAVRIANMALDKLSKLQQIKGWV